jgi:diaminohydroxyphosphoribosylaminopyrimidine deaminase/5-amino-6-(5-phosphoribosylamino)uracil reductase
MDDEYFMKMALDLAQKGQGHTSPNPMVGAVVVKEGKVKGSGYHQAIGLAHAEVNAIEDAGSQTKGATLYVNLDGGGAVFLNKHGIEVLIGICEEPAKKLNEAFVKFVHTKRPFVLLKCAATLDGRIATRTGDSKWVTGDKARKFVHQLRHSVDAILVGVGTIRSDDPSLTTRLDSDNGLDPVRIVLDTHLSIPPSARILQLDSNSDTILVTGTRVAENKKRAVEKKGVRLIELPVNNDGIEMQPLLDRLGQMGITSLLIEGGSRVIASAFSSSIVDKVLFFYAPKILGGDDGIPICQGPGPELMKDCIRVKNIRVQQFDEDVMIEGYIS